MWQQPISSVPVWVKNPTPVSGLKLIEIIKKYDDRILISNIGIKTARIIFQNLLTNAIKYSSEKGKVEISIEKSDTGIHIYIKDYGYGIPEKAKKFIFTKLYLL